MSKKVLVISTSLRPNSNSDVLAREFTRGAREAGHAVELLSLQGNGSAVLHRLYGLPESTQMCHSGRREYHC